MSVLLASAAAASDERPTAHEEYCLWLLRLSPDQVYRSPLRGPLIGSRRSGEPPLTFVRTTGRDVKGGYRARNRKFPSSFRVARHGRRRLFDREAAIDKCAAVPGESTGPAWPATLYPPFGNRPPAKRSRPNLEQKQSGYPQ